MAVGVEYHGGLDGIGLGSAIGGVLITRWDVVTKVGGESVTGDGLEHGKAGMVDPTESSSMVSRGYVNRLLGKAVEELGNPMVGGVVD
mgnify:CR=1 FL=1